MSLGSEHVVRLFWSEPTLEKSDNFLDGKLHFKKAVDESSASRETIEEVKQNFMKFN